MDEKTLSEIEARAAGAAPGPWRVALDPVSYSPGGAEYARHEHVWGPSITIDHGWGDDEYRQRWSRDRAFIAHAREDVPALVAEVRRLRAEVERLTVEQRSHCGGVGHQRGEDEAGPYVTPCFHCMDTAARVVNGVANAARPTLDDAVKAMLVSAHIPPGAAAARAAKIHEMFVQGFEERLAALKSGASNGT